MRFFRILSAPSAVVAALTFAPGAFAAALAPGATLGALTDNAGTVTTLITSQSSVVGSFGSIPSSGTLISAVYHDSGGGLDFVYEYIVSTGDIGSLSPATFSGFTTDVGAITTFVGGEAAQFSPFTDGGIGPTTTSRVSGAGSAIDFHWSPANTTKTAILIVKTNATTFQTSAVGIIEGVPTSAPGYTPAPEPAQAGLLLGGIFAAGLFVARKFRVQRS
jgi:hypothetical protein